MYPEQPCVSGFFLMTLSWVGSPDSELRVPLELQQVTQVVFIVVMQPPLELQLGRSSIVVIFRLPLSSCNVQEAIL